MDEEDIYQGLVDAGYSEEEKEKLLKEESTDEIYNQFIEEKEEQTSADKKGNVTFKRVNHNERATKLRRISDGDTAIYLNVALKYFRNRCALSGEKFVGFGKDKIKNSQAKSNLSAEHVVALCQGGDDVYPNIVPAILQYNLKKNGYYLLDWWIKQKDNNGKDLYSPYRLLKLVNYVMKSLDFRKKNLNNTIKANDYEKAILIPDEINIFLKEVEKQDELENNNTKRKIFSDVVTSTELDEDNKKILQAIPNLERNIPREGEQLDEKYNDINMMDIFLSDAINVLKQDSELNKHKDFSKIIVILETMYAEIQGTISFEVEIRNIILEKLKEQGIDENIYTIANDLLRYSDILKIVRENRNNEELIEEYISKYFSDKEKKLSEELNLTKEDIKTIIEFFPSILYQEKNINAIKNIINYSREIETELKNLLQNVNITELLNILELEEWCIEKFGTEEKPKVEKYKWRTPNLKDYRFVKSALKKDQRTERETEEQRENRIAKAIRTIKLTNKFWEQYEENPEQIPEYERSLIKKIKKIEDIYDKSDLECNIMELEEWCQEKFGTEEEPKVERYKWRTPNSLNGVKVAPKKDQKTERETEEQREKRLAKSVEKIKRDNKYWKLYEKNPEEVPKYESQLINRLIKIEELYNMDKQTLNLGQAIEELEEWCKEKFGTEEEPKVEKYKWRTPIVLVGIEIAPKEDQKTEGETEEQRERRIAQSIRNLKHANKYWNVYEKNPEKVPEYERSLIDKLKRIEEIYSVDKQTLTLGETIQELEEWCIEKFGTEEKPKVERYKWRTPNQLTEVKFAPKEDQKTERETEEQREYRIASSVQNIKRTNKYWNVYEKNPEKVPEYERSLIDKLKRIEEIYSVDKQTLTLGETIQELEEWCIEKFGTEEKPKVERYKWRTPNQLTGVKFAPKEDQKTERETEEQREYRLAKSINYIKKANKFWIQFEKNPEKVPEYERSLIDKLKRIEEIYSVDKQTLTLGETIQELEEWCIEKFGTEEKPKVERYKWKIPHLVRRSKGRSKRKSKNRKRNRETKGKKNSSVNRLHKKC